MSTPVFVVTDIEVDGPWPGPNSMRSFASVAVTGRGDACGEFEAVLEALPGAQPNPDTYAWFQTVPDAWAAATRSPRPVPTVMEDFTDWVLRLGDIRHFVAAPLGFDGLWMDYYLRRFTPYAVCQGPYEGERLFHGPGVCLHSLACGATGSDPATFSVHDLPTAWFGDVPHTHDAIDDARGYAHLLLELLRRRQPSTSS
ncbi:MAG: hypothetical protein QOK15_2592 [Nocardioidaceae bacterium]|nr:hypothetical protein [Nocardioidaceae bacterium]